VSVHRKAKAWVAVWRDHTGAQRSKSFRTWAEADRHDRDLKDARDRGTLAQLDAGRETLDEYVTGVWIPVHVATLAPKTAELYAGLYDRHVSPGLGGYPLRELNPEVIGRWQSDRLAAGAPVESTRKALTLLGGILQRAFEAGRIGSNPQRLVRKAAPAPSEEVRPLAPAGIEAICGVLRPRDRQFVRLLAYAGLRPQEARALRWANVGERTLTVHAPKTRRHRTQPRSVRLLAPLAQDLREWRMLSGRPVDGENVVPGHAGGEWSEAAYKLWSRRAWATALEAAGLDYRNPYALRHSFASLLIHEGRSVVSVAAQLGHSPAVCLRVYAHVLAELEDAPRISAEDAIAQARAAADVGSKLDSVP
jgi:integrase